MKFLLNSEEGNYIFVGFNYLIILNLGLGVSEAAACR